MSEDKKIQNLIINKLTKEQYNSIETKSNNELYDIVDDAHFTAEEIEELLGKKQNSLTAGDGIEILENGTINNTRVSAEWGNIQGDLSTQTDLQELVSTKVDKQDGKSLISDTEIERLANVDNYDDTLVLSDISDLKVNKQNKLTAGTGIEISEDNIISATGTQGGSLTWGSIDGDIKSQEDLQDELNTRGSKLEYTGSTLSLLNSNDEVLNSINITSGGTTVEVDIATVDKAGIVKPDGETISVDDNGTISANIPNVDTSNLANIDLSNITDLGLQNILSTLANVAKTGSYNDLIDVPEQYSLPIASTVELGGVKVDGDTINVDESGIISANIPDIDTSQFVQKSGDTMTGVLNFKNASSDKIRMTQGDYTAILHQNGESLYFLLTNQGDQDGLFNDLRPFSIVLADGRLRGNHTLSMPSSISTSLTLGTSGSTYTAPANGYFVVSGLAGSTAGYVDMRNASAGGLGALQFSPNPNIGLRSFVPVKKGDVVSVSYSSSFGSNGKYFMFVYAEGST